MLLLPHWVCLAIWKVPLCISSMANGSIAHEEQFSTHKFGNCFFMTLYTKLGLKCDLSTNDLC